uniref:Uncharacterized protein n=1 Tax=Alexandrium andersonii TaxID=327968 RepID=A0A7S2DCK0_9DINO
MLLLLLLQPAGRPRANRTDQRGRADPSAGSHRTARHVGIVSPMKLHLHWGRALLPRSSAELRDDRDNAAGVPAQPLDDSLPTIAALGRRWGAIQKARVLA